MKTDWSNIDKQILERRAAELAKPLDAFDESTEVVTVLEFTLMAKRHAIELDTIDAVTRIGDIISIPLTPPHISGIIRRGGKSYTLMSIRHFFSKQAEGLADADFAIIASANDKQFALQVEEIQGVIHVDKKKLIPPPDNFDPEQAPYVSAVTTDGLIMIDLNRLVSAHGFGMDARK